MSPPLPSFPLSLSSYFVTPFSPRNYPLPSFLSYIHRRTYFNTYLSLFPCLVPGGVIERKGMCTNLLHYLRRFPALTLFPSSFFFVMNGLSFPPSLLRDLCSENFSYPLSIHIFAYLMTLFLSPSRIHSSIFPNVKRPHFQSFVFTVSCIPPSLSEFFYRCLLLSLLFPCI